MIDIPLVLGVFSDEVGRIRLVLVGKGLEGVD